MALIGTINEIPTSKFTFMIHFEFWNFTVDFPADHASEVAMSKEDIFLIRIKH